MIKNTVKKFGGFTLVEVLITVFIFTVLTLGASTITLTIFRNYKQQSQSLSSVEQVTLVSSKFTSELRNANYGNNGSYPLNSAGDSQIIFYSSSGATGTLINRIRYYLSGNTLYKGIVIPTGNPLTYTLSSEIVNPVQNNVVNATTSTPVFYYYDGNYNGSGNPLSQPVNVNQVKFVKINLIVLKQPGVSTTTTFTFDTGAAMRNLKNNLGN